ncbi:MAG: ASCH domain-containing protein [Clostridia bacterium]
MNEAGNPTNSLIYNIGDLGESELLMEVLSDNPSNRTAAVMGIAERFDDEQVLAVLSRMKIKETNKYTLNEIEKTISNILMKKNVVNTNTYDMKLYDLPFNKIKNGSKTIEIRLFDEKRKKLKVGDYINFSNLENEKETMKVRILALHKYDSFLELYTNNIPEKFGCKGYSIDQLMMTTYGIYSKEQELYYGVLGIEIEYLKVTE